MIQRETALRLIDIEQEGNRTTKEYRKILTRNAKCFFAWMESQNISDILNVGKAELVSYFRHVCGERSVTGTRTIGEPLSRATINWRVLGAKKIFAALYLAGFLAKNPFHGLDLGTPPERSFKRRPFTEAQMTELLEQIDPSTRKGLRDRAMFELIYSSGLRVCEASRLTMRDIDLERREIVVHGKGSRDRLVPISTVARDFLRLFIGERITRLEEPVFRGTWAKGEGKAIRPEEISQRFHNLLIKFGMDGEGRSTHAVRHSTATHLLDHGASVRHIQELLGHKNIDTTVRYTQVQTEGLQKIYRKYHPGEHELFEVVDEAYEKRLESLGAGKER